MYYKASITQFVIPMSFLGVAFNLNHFQSMLEWSSALSSIFFGLGIISFCIIFLTYSLQLFHFKNNQYLIDEWRHPEQINLFAVFSFCLLLLFNTALLFSIESEWMQSTLYMSYFIVVSAHTFIAFKLFLRWLYDIKMHINILQPTWFIVFSGNFYVVISGSFFLEGEVRELLWFYFSYSLFSLMTVMILMFYRLFFEQALSKNLRPSLFIFLASPSLGTLATILMFDSSNGVPVLAWVLYSFATLMFILWLTAIKYFIECSLSIVSWGYVYPLAAYGLANQYLYEINGGLFFLVMSYIIIIIALGFAVLMATWQMKQIFNYWKTSKANNIRP